MASTGFVWILLAAALYGALHSLLASNQSKALAARMVGQDAAQRYYRLFFVIVVSITLLPLLALVGLLPDAPLYTIPSPWRWLTLLLQGAALVGIVAAVSQTGAMSFLGFRQAFEYDPARSEPRPEKLVINGFYAWARHPIYTFSFILLWLTPVMTWNLLAMDLSLSVYMLVGAYFFEEPKLVEQFGDTYRRYRACTPMIIPGLKFSSRR